MITLDLGVDQKKNLIIKKGEVIIARRQQASPQVSRDQGARINQYIDCNEIRLIGSKGENIGLVSPGKGIELAEEESLDLVEISPNATPPVCKIMDYGKYKYEQQKKEAEAKKKQKTIDVKEIKFRPNTDIHDYEVKMRSVTKFLDNGDKVKITMRFRGREMAHQELGKNLLERVAEDTSEIGKIDSIPKIEGRQMTMIISPLK